MHDQPRMKPLRRSDFFADAREGRPLLPGTVARGQLNEDAYFLTGFVAPGQYGDKLPFPLTAEVLARGQERFNIYCSPCHSRIGDGNGMIVQRGYRKPPSFHTEGLRNVPLGHFVDVMTNGFGAMPDYSQQVPPSDRWAIAAYIRALQLAQNATLNDVPENMRSTIVNASSTLAPFVPVGIMGERGASPVNAGEAGNMGQETGGAANPQAPGAPQQQNVPPGQQLRPGGTQVPVAEPRAMPTQKLPGQQKKPPQQKPKQQSKLSTGDESRWSSVIGRWPRPSALQANDQRPTTNNAAQRPAGGSEF